MKDKADVIFEFCKRCGTKEKEPNHLYCLDCFRHIVRSESKTSYFFYCYKCGNFFKSFEYRRNCRQCEPYNNKEILKNFIYFAADGSGLVKIGKTSDIARRLSGLKTSNPRIEYLFYFEDLGNVNLEKIIHKEFESKRITGEWFDLSLEDLNKIINEYKVDSVLLLDLPKIEDFLHE